MTTAQLLARYIAANKRNILRLNRALSTATYWLHAHEREARALYIKNHPNTPLANFPDVSSYQGAINWQAAAHYYSAAEMKVSEGVTWIDPDFGANLRACHRYGIPVLAYHFCHPGTNDPRAEARHAVATVKAAGGLRKGDIGLELDCEVTQLGAQGTTDWCNAFHAEVARLQPNWPQVLYTSALFNAWGPLKYQLVIVADYGQFQNPTGVPAEKVIAWQYTDSARVVGVSGPCDENKWTIGRDRFNALRIK